MATAHRIQRVFPCLGKVRRTRPSRRPAFSLRALLSHSYRAGILPHSLSGLLHCQDLWSFRWPSKARNGGTHEVHKWKGRRRSDWTLIHTPRGKGEAMSGWKALDSSGSIDGERARRREIGIFGGRRVAEDLQQRLGKLCAQSCTCEIASAAILLGEAGLLLPES